jgi:hypothetical protein
MAGVKRPSINGAIKSGKVAKEKDGTIDPTRKINADYIARQKEKRHSAGGEISPRSKQKAPPSSRGRKNVTLINADHVNIGTEEDPENQDAVELSQEEKKQKVIKLQLENAIKRGEYIERQLTGQWIMRFYGTMSSVWRAMSGRVMPDMIAKIRSSANDDDALRDGSKIMDDAIYEGLEQIRDVMLTFGKRIPQLVVLKEGGNGKPRS